MAIKIHIDTDILEKIGKFELPQKLGFGEISGPIMASAEFKNGEWSDLSIIPFGPITLYPTAKVFHYAQEIFEGLKAYNYNNNGPLLFRTNENYKRFVRSSERLAMPAIPEELFEKAIESVVSYSYPIMPKRAGESLYLRPLLIATDNIMSVRPSLEYRFFVLTSPSGDYFSSSTIGVLIEREQSRAFPGGIGFAKTGGNYAASLMAYKKAKELGLSQTLWLDALEHKYIEELSGMNFFAIINGELHTPELNDTILEGVTRDSLLKLAAHNGIKVVERKMPIDELLRDIKNHQCTEAFACGTAAVVTPLTFLQDANGERFEFQNQSAPIGMMLKSKLLDIQEGRSVDPFGWTRKVQGASLQ